MKDDKVVVFDLDDTLISEYDYLKSAYEEIANLVDCNNPKLLNRMLELYNLGSNVFDYIISNYEACKLSTLLDIYRNHKPNINLKEGAIRLLKLCKDRGYVLGLISDGRSITQRNKLKATSIEELFDEIIISEEFGSEKPNEKNYMAFDKYNGQKYYIADNTKKDFVTPNRLGWTTICLKDDGFNIHKQSFELDKEFLPQYIYTTLNEMENHFNNSLKEG